jgi:DNA-binding beta-propeller fold protein YncE
VGVVVNSTELSLTIFDVDDPSDTRTVGLGPDGSPVSLALRGGLAAVPLGVVPAVAVVDLASATLLRTVALPEGSGATGAAFVNDSIVLVANPELGSVSPVNVRSGSVGAEIDVGVYPQAIVVSGERAYVVNAGLVAFETEEPSSLTVIDTGSLEPVGTIALGGENGATAATSDGETLWVLHSGNFGAGDGALSEVDLDGGVEAELIEGWGEFPGSLAVHDDRIVAGAFGVGLMVWDAATRTFVHAPDDALTPDGVASTSGVAFDREGRLYALTPDCQEPSAAHRLTAAGAVELTVPVGICPLAIAFTLLSPEL